MGGPPLGGPPPAQGSHRRILRIAGASWLVVVIVREYGEIEAGTKSSDLDTHERVCEPFGWPRWFAAARKSDGLDPHRLPSCRLS